MESYGNWCHGVTWWVSCCSSFASEASYLQSQAGTQRGFIPNSTGSRCAFDLKFTHRKWMNVARFSETWFSRDFPSVIFNSNRFKNLSYRCTVQSSCFVGINPRFVGFTISLGNLWSHLRGELDHEKIFQAIQKAKQTELERVDVMKTADGIYMDLLEFYKDEIWLIWLIIY